MTLDEQFRQIKAMALQLKTAVLADKTSSLASRELSAMLVDATGKLTVPHSKPHRPDSGPAPTTT